MIDNWPVRIRRGDRYDDESERGAESSAAAPSLALLSSIFFPSTLPLSRF